MAHSHVAHQRAIRSCSALAIATLLALTLAASPAPAASAAALPTVHFSAASYTQNETGGAATISVQLSAASSRAITVHYATSNGSAIALRDYFPTGGDLTFEPGKTSKIFNVPIRDDVINEPDETIKLALSAPSGATLGVPAVATLTIFDNEELTAPSSLIYLPVALR